MTVIGILGGMGPPSTVEYYLELNRAYAREFGGTPEVIIYSVDFQRLHLLQDSEDDEAYVSYLLRCLERLVAAGAALAIVASNTPHRVFDKLSSSLDIPMVSIVDSVLGLAVEKGLKRLLLLGTYSTMTAGFYQRQAEKAGIEVITPDTEEMKAIDELIFNHLVRGYFPEEGRDTLLGIVKRHPSDAVILGCTELPLLLGQEHTDVPLINTISAHVNAVIEYLKRAGNENH